MKTLALITLFLPMFAAASQPANRVTVNKVDDWKVWISSHFPDSSSSWSEPCKNGLTKLQEDQKWDFVAAGDLTGHDIPAALGMNFGETFFETATAVKKLAVYLCQSGSWQESLSLDTRVIKLGGEKASTELAPSIGPGYYVDLADLGKKGTLRGLSVYAYILNSKGVGLNDGARYYFDADEKKYDYDAD